MAKQTDNVLIDNARILFRNFEGKEGPFNPPGRRNFCVLLDPEMANALKDNGWNIRYLSPREESDDPQPYLQATVNYANKPPTIVVITSRGRTILDEETLKTLDWAEFEKVDLILSPYNWVMHEGTSREQRGVKAYVKSMYVTIAEDELERRYHDAPENNVTPIGECVCGQCDHNCGGKGECRYDD